MLDFLIGKNHQPGNEGRPAQGRDSSKGSPKQFKQECFYLKKNPNKLAKIIIKKNPNGSSTQCSVEKTAREPPWGSAPAGHRSERDVGQRASWKKISKRTQHTHWPPKTNHARTQSEAEPDARWPLSREPGPLPTWGHSTANIPPLPIIFLQLARQERFGRSGKGGEWVQRCSPRCRRGKYNFQQLDPSSIDSHPITSSKSCWGWHQLSFEPVPPGTSRPHPPQQCSPRWRRASGGCGPPLHRRPGGDLRRARGW